MVRAGADLIDEADFIVPVPLYRWRLWSRRFNQSAKLAMGIAKQTGKPLAVDALDRIRATRQQIGLSASERDRNVSGAFRIADKWRHNIAGRSVLLIDDVYTTGATVKSATRPLKRAGVKNVDVLVFARVVQGGE